MPLTMVNPGTKVNIKSIQAGQGLQTRLTSMGFIPGSEIEVIRNDPRGPFIVGVKNSRVILGRGMAHKILVH